MPASERPRSDLPSEDGVRELAATRAIRIRPLRTPIPALTKRAAAKVIHGKLCQIISQNSGCEQER
jgi:hypothetical protein